MYQALHATSVTLQQFLADQIGADTFLSAATAPFVARGMSVALQTPTEMLESGREGVSLWLYRVVRDENRLNDSARRIDYTHFRPAPLPLRLHYLVTPVTTRENLGDPDTEQYLLGKVLQSFHTRADLRGAALRGEFDGTDVELFVRLEPLELDEIARVWDALEGSYQLSVSYEVSLVNVDSMREPDGRTPVTDVVAEIGQIVGTA